MFGHGAARGRDKLFKHIKTLLEIGGTNDQHGDKQIRINGISNNDSGVKCNDVVVQDWPGVCHL